VTVGATPLPMNEVKRLDDSAAHIRKGDLVVAVFPETTSFYKGSFMICLVRLVIIKSPLLLMLF